MRNEPARTQKDSSVDRWEDLSPELWEVQLGRSAKLMTLDELDAAFHADVITTSTLVRRPGTFHYKTLAEIAGLEPSAITLESESLVPVASDVALPEIPKAAPAPSGFTRIDSTSLAPARRAPEKRSATRKLASLGVVALVGGAVFFGVSAYYSGALGNLTGGSTLAAMAPAPADPAAAALAEPPTAPLSVTEGASPKAPFDPSTVIEDGAVLVLAKQSDEPAAPPEPVTAPAPVPAPVKAAPPAVRPAARSGVAFGARAATPATKTPARVAAPARPPVARPAAAAARPATVARPAAPPRTGKPAAPAAKTSTAPGKKRR